MIKNVIEALLIILK